jgi:hypothetical protein
MYGLSDEEIAAIREGKFDGFTAAEVCLLRMADALAETPATAMIFTANCESTFRKNSYWS